MGTFKILKAGESGTKSHSDKLMIEFTGGLVLENDWGHPPMAFESIEIGVTGLDVIPETFP